MTQSDNSLTAVGVDKENTDYSSLRFSDILFTDSDGLGLRFAMRPCHQRRAVRTLVERGGGHMVSNTGYASDSINLVTVDANISDHHQTDSQYYYMTYVLDSCKANELLAINTYEVLPTADESDHNVIENILTNEVPPKPSSSSLPPTMTSEETEESGNKVDDNVVDNDSYDEEFADVDEVIAPEKQLSAAKTFFNSYLAYIQSGETSTPDRLIQIKSALKANADHQNKEKQNKNPLKVKHTFGSKILRKTRNDRLKQTSPSQESGYRVSDISSGELSDKELSDSDSSVVTATSRTQQKTTTVINMKQKTNKPIVTQIKLPLNPMKTNSLYTLSEDEAILEFIIKSNRLDELRGKVLWEEAETNDVCIGRSWQSMKERFKKKIMPEIDEYDILSKKDRQRLKTNYYSEKVSDSKLPPVVGAYSEAEDKHILNQIISKRGFDVVKGNKFWRDFVDDFNRKTSGQSRTWQSLKERYLKRVGPNLYKYQIKPEIATKMLNSLPNLSDSEKSQILKKCQMAIKKSMDQPLDPKKTTKKRKDDDSSGGSVSADRPSSAKRQPKESLPKESVVTTAATTVEDNSSDVRDKTVRKIITRSQRRMK
ncbi:uncharacterized protein LOC128953933 [Oppia nitens]|uniref:uncharacterized protein LOC128953933 n=1 Tax=Oppia nitens TaxID=1686743 RepID=UPI0023DBF50D|nr:uncharacterized protein LOC128953933 [Oppia nitens]